MEYLAAQTAWTLQDWRYTNYVCGRPGAGWGEGYRDLFLLVLPYAGEGYREFFNIFVGSVFFVSASNQATLNGSTFEGAEIEVDTWTKKEK